MVTSVFLSFVFFCILELVLRFVFRFLTEFKKKSSWLLLDVYVRLLLGGKAFVNVSVTTVDIVDVACACDLTDTC